MVYMIRTQSNLHTFIAALRIHRRRHARHIQQRAHDKVLAGVAGRGKGSAEPDPVRPQIGLAESDTNTCTLDVQIEVKSKSELP